MFIGAAVSAVAASAQRPGQSPNIILIVSDDRGYADLGCQGATDLLTPHIDALAASQRQTAVRSGNWKLVVNGIVADGAPEGSTPLTGEDAVFLSRIDTDPGETRNLRRSEPKIVDELQSGIAAWQTSLGQR